ncbi:phasin family protein [Marinivivus vitaminiproducens]|uniref:phasin family protein n=1 Tax=Marinivivus vitaminiproducens TaxID=3035935 RepID=UPI00279DDAFE|nr:phasin family protein [Geminicoccaceae bacterium SCSIO 64248]
MATPNAPFGFPDLNQFFQAFRIPDLFSPGAVSGVDPRELFLIQQRNFEALAKAQGVLIEAGQNVMQRQVEILQTAMGEATKAGQSLMQDPSGKGGPAKGFDAARKSFEQSIGNMNELSDLASKANAKAVEIVRSRALAAFDEVKAAVDKGTKG